MLRRPEVQSFHDKAYALPADMPSAVIASHVRLFEDNVHNETRKISPLRSEGIAQNGGATGSPCQTQSSWHHYTGQLPARHIATRIKNPLNFVNNFSALRVPQEWSI